MTLVSAQGLSPKASELPFSICVAAAHMMHLVKTLQGPRIQPCTPLHSRKFPHRLFSAASLSSAFRHSIKIPCPCKLWQCVRLTDGLTLPHILPSPVEMHGIRGILSALYLPISRCFIPSESHGPKLCLQYTRLPTNPTRSADHTS